MALAISRMMDQGTLDPDRIGGGDPQSAESSLRQARRPAGRLCWRHRPGRIGGGYGCARASAGPAGPARQRRVVEHLPWADGAHPLRRGVYGAPHLLDAPESRAEPSRTRERRSAPPSGESHRPGKPTLEDEFRQACAAIETGRDAIDRLTARPAWGGPGDLAGPLDHSRAASGDPDELGRLRHGRPHRHRVVGYAAFAPADEVHAAAPPRRAGAASAGRGRPFGAPFGGRQESAGPDRGMPGWNRGRSRRHCRVCPRAGDGPRSRARLHARR